MVCLSHEPYYFSTRWNTNGPNIPSFHCSIIPIVSEAENYLEQTEFAARPVIIPLPKKWPSAVGRAVAVTFKDPGNPSTIVVGRDTRLSGAMLESALVTGICSVGSDAAVAGVIPTPGVAFLAFSL